MLFRSEILNDVTSFSAVSISSSNLRKFNLSLSTFMSNFITMSSSMAQIFAPVSNKAYVQCDCPFAWIVIGTIGLVTVTLPYAAKSHWFGLSMCKMVLWPPPHFVHLKVSLSQSIALWPLHMHTQQNLPNAMIPISFQHSLQWKHCNHQFCGMKYLHIPRISSHQNFLVSWRMAFVEWL